MSNEEVIKILESYMTFVTIAERTIMNFAELPEKIELMFKTLVRKTRSDWMPVLEEIKYNAGEDAVDKLAPSGLDQ